MCRYVLAITMVIMCLQAKGQVTSDVRKVVWGMTKEEVRNTEKLEEIRIDLPGLTKDLILTNDERKAFHI